MESARNLMIEQGVNAVTVRGVARAAGISPGNLGYHFATYDDLLHALMERVINPYLQTFEILRAESLDDPLASLRAVLAYVLDDLATEETTMFFPELWVLANRSERAAEYMKELYDNYLSVIQGIIQAARTDLSIHECRQLALFICASIEGQTVFIGYQRQFLKHRTALKGIALDVMVTTVANHVSGKQFLQA